MLVRLSKTLSTNAAIAGTVALVIGASGGAATLTAGSDDPSTPGATQTEHDDADTDADTDADKAETDKPDSDADEKEADEPKAQASAAPDVRPTDTHGYCVSQLAQSAPTERTASGDNHGTLVSAAAQACGKTTAADKAAREAARSTATTHGKAYGHHHGTGRPAAVTAGH